VELSEETTEKIPNDTTGNRSRDCPTSSAAHIYIYILVYTLKITTIPYFATPGLKSNPRRARIRRIYITCNNGGKRIRTLSRSALIVRSKSLLLYCYVGVTPNRGIATYRRRAEPSFKSSSGRDSLGAAISHALQANCIVLCTQKTLKKCPAHQWGELRRRERPQKYPAEWGRDIGWTFSVSIHISVIQLTSRLWMIWLSLWLLTTRQNRHGSFAIKFLPLVRLTAKKCQMLSSNLQHLEILPKVADVLLSCVFDGSNDRDYFALNINRFFFITDKGFLYCAARTESLNTIENNFRLQRLYQGSGGDRCPLKLEDHVRSHTSPCQIYGRQSGNDIGFSLSTPVFPCQNFSTSAPVLISSQMMR